MPYNEDTLVQQTTAEYLERQLGWQSVYAYNNEDFGPDSLLGRSSDREVVLTRPLREKLHVTTTGCERSWPSTRRWRRYWGRPTEPRSATPPSPSQTP